MSLRQTDPDIALAIDAELKRQRNNIELIASENFTSKAVMEATGSVLTNKYAEGYPGKRYYGGCEFVDVAETLAINRAKALFGAEYANVQPHSGAQANTAVYFHFLKPGDKVLGMNLNHGGHLTHGSAANISGQLYSFIPYGVDPVSERIDYAELRRLALEHRPKMIVGGASAYPRKIDFAKMREIANEINAILFVDMAHIAGLVVAGLHDNPVPYCDVVTSTTHKTLRGPRGGLILAKAEYEKQLNKAIFPGIQGGPLMHVIAGKAVAFKEAATPEFVAYQQQIVKNAAALANALLKLGYQLVSGGTDNHLMIINVKATLGITGKVAEAALDAVHITVNKNTLPFETESPFVTSGIRIGTPAATTRGMKEADMVTIASIIDRTLRHLDDAAMAEACRKDVLALTQQFALYD